MLINTYLMFKGNCEAAFRFYEKALGGKVVAMMTHEGTPAAAHTPPDWQKKIIHARMMIGDGVLMASDAPPDRFEKPQGFFVSLNVRDPAEAERLFAALSPGAEVRMPIQETFWALRFAMLVDQFGTPWMINCEKPM